MAFLLGLVLSIILATFISSLINMAISKCMGFKFSYFRFLFWDISSINGEIKLTTRSFMPICQNQMLKPGITDKKDNIHAFITCVATLILSSLIFFIIFINRPSRYSLDMEVPYTILLGIAVGILINGIVKLSNTINFVATKNKRLFYYNKQIAQNWVGGHPLESLNIPPLESLNVKGSMPEKQNYQCLRFLQRLYMNDYNSLANIVCWLESNRAESLLKFETPVYYNILFYYTYISFNPEKSNYYFNIIHSELLNDTDSNGRRILAYYQFYVLKNPSQARATAANGLSVLNKFSNCNQEREFEAKLLNDLIYSIDSHAPYQNN